MSQAVLFCGPRDIIYRMTSEKSLSLPVSTSSEVAFHLWPTGEERRPPDWRALQSVLVRRRKQLLATFASVLVFFVLILAIMPPIYRATATLQVHTSSPYVSENDLPVLTDITGSNQGRSLVTQSEILQNDAVRERALQLLGPDQRQRVGGVAVKSIPETDLITVSASSRNAQVSAAYANALCNAYLELSEQKNRAQYSTARQYVETQMDAARVRLDKARAALRKYKEQYGTVDLAAQTQDTLNEFNRVQSEWRQARANKIAALAQLNQLKSFAAGLKPTIDAASTIVRSPQLVAMQARLTDLELRRVEALQEYQANAPEVRELDRQIGILRGQLRNQAQTEVQSVQQSPNPLRVDAEQNIVRLRGEVLSQEARGVALKGLAKRLQAELDQLPAREQRLGQLTTDLNGLQQSYQTLNQKYQNLRASEAARVASGILLFPAQVPGAAARKLNPLNLAICIILASLLALGGVVLTEKLDDRVRGPRDLPNGGNLRVLTQVPEIGVSGEQYLFNTRALISPLLENFRALWAMIGLSAQAAGKKPPRSVAVTSALPQEGKSLVAVNLAVASALSGAQVVLVDCDLRWPVLHLLCGRRNEVGFINVANGEVSLEAALQTTRVPGLRVLTSGPRTENPFQALNSPAGREVIRRLNELADFVVVDTPPVLMLADARVTASLVDSVILVVSTDQPNRQDVQQAQEMLINSGADIAGIVLNKVEQGPDFRDYYDLYTQTGNTFTTDAQAVKVNRNATLMPQDGSSREK